MSKNQFVCMRGLITSFVFVFFILSAGFAQDDHEAYLKKNYPIPRMAKNVLGDSIKLENLGPKVNTNFMDMSPKVTPDGQRLYFWVAKRSQTGERNDFGTQEIYYSDKTDAGWSASQKAPDPLNTHEQNAVLKIFDDGNKILVRDDHGKRKGFAVLEKEGESWGKQKSVGIKHYNRMAQGAFHGATVSSDGSIMIMYFSEVDGSTFNDLYISFKEKEDKWDYSEPQPIKSLNTDKDEYAPFLAADDKTLFFTSTRFGGLGGDDIYVSKRLDKNWKAWSKAQNAGYPINTKKYDAYFSIDNQGNAFLSSTRESMSGIDIFGINPVIVKPKPPKDTTVEIRGSILNSKTREPINVEGLVHMQVVGEDETPYEIGSNPDGSYAMEVVYGKKYKLWPAVEDFLTDDEVIVDLSDMEDGDYVAYQDLLVTPIEIGTKVRLDHIYFDYGKATLRPESFPELNKVIKFMNDYPSVRIEIAGHTDSDGSASFNQKLSQNRAESVRNYIVQQGKIEASRITAKGYGEEQPVASNETDEGKQMNRRVEFEILKK